MTSPTQRSKALMESEGFTVAIVEHWNPFARIRQDLFGAFDLLGISNKGTIAVQTTSASNVSARINKLAGLPTVGIARDAGWGIFVHGWKKAKDGKWTCRIVDIS